MEFDKKKWITAAILLLVGVLSFTVIAPYASSKDAYQKYTESLDEKRDLVLKMTGAATATSLAITLLPGDTATPIAEKLMDLSGYFLLVLCAIFLEKYLLTITGYAAFKILIPLAMLIFIVSLFWKPAPLRRLAVKLVVFGLAIVLVIPVSISASDMIEKTYEESIAGRIESAEENLRQIESVTRPENEKEDAKEEEPAKQPEEPEQKADSPESTWDAIKNAFSNATEKAESAADQAASIVSDAVSGVSNTISAAMSGELLEKAEDTLNQFVDAIAVMIITSCVIPILIILFFFLLIKLVLGVQLSFLPEQKTEK